MITTYNSNCLKCLNGSLHPWHDDGTPAEVLGNDDRFSQLPSERRTEPCKCKGCGNVHRGITRRG